MKLYVNTAAAQPDRALVLSPTARQASVAAPQVMLGDKRSVDLHLIAADGSYITTGTPRLGIGSAAVAPSSGTFPLSDGTATTAALDYDASGDAVAAALNALNSGAGPGGSAVHATRSALGIYTVTWQTNGAHDLLTASANNLDPDAQVIISRVRSGDTDTREKQIIRLIQRPAIYVHQWTPIADGWRAILNANTTRALQFLAASASYPIAPAILEIEHTDTQGLPTTYVRKDTVIMAQSVDPNTLEGADLPTALDTSDVTVPRYRLDLTTLTGGTAAALDAVETTGLTIGTLYIIGASISPAVPGILWQLKTAESRPAATSTIVHSLDSSTHYWQLLGS